MRFPSAPPSTESGQARTNLAAVGKEDSRTDVISGPESELGFLTPNLMAPLVLRAYLASEMATKPDGLAAAA
jgi:hypothetical protein